MLSSGLAVILSSLEGYTDIFLGPWGQYQKFVFAKLTMTINVSGPAKSWLSQNSSSSCKNLWHTINAFVVKLAWVKRRLVKKKRILADRKHIPTPTPYGQLNVQFFDVSFILDYDSMCSEMDITPEKSSSSNYKNSQLLLREASVQEKCSFF